MEIRAPIKWMFWVSLVLAVIAFIANFIPALTESAFWIAFIAYILLMFGTLIKGK